jgi:methionine sulfoxide reductase heme-binding subunit
MTPIVGVTSSRALWFASRGTGVVCLLLLTASVVLGIITTVRFETPHWPRFVLEGLHRNVSLLILVFICLHVATTVIDGFAPIGYIDAVVPFHSPYRTLWLGLGAVAFDLLLALAITSVMRARLGYRIWRGVHWAAYACWPIALMHGLGTGSDARQGWMVALDVIALASVCAAVCWRLAVTWRPDLPVQWGAVAALVVVPLGVGLWAFLGPLQPGWARAKPSAAARLAAIEPESAGFGGTVAGTRAVSASGASGLTTVSIRGAVSSPLGLQVDLELTGRPRAQGVALDVGKLTLGPSAAPGRWSGRVVQLNGGHVEARVADRFGHGLAVDLELQVGPAGRAFSGTISARAVVTQSESGQG